MSNYATAMNMVDALVNDILADRREKKDDHGHAYAYACGVLQAMLAEALTSDDSRIRTLESIQKRINGTVKHNVIYE